MAIINILTNVRKFEVIPDEIPYNITTSTKVSDINISDDTDHMYIIIGEIVLVITLIK